MRSRRLDPAAARRRTGRRRRIAAIVATLLFFVAATGGLAALRLADPFVVRTVRESAFDLMQRLSPREHVEAPVRIVAIDETALQEFGQWPWPRERLAEMVDRLHAAGAATVVFDFVFAEPDRLSPARLARDPRFRQALGEQAELLAETLPDSDAALAEAMARGRVVIGFGSAPLEQAPPPLKAGFAHTGRDPVPHVNRLEGATPVVPVLAEAAQGIGSISLGPDLSFGVVRRAPLVWTDGTRLYPSLVAEALRVAQGASTHVVHVDPAGGGVQAVRIGGFEVPATPEGELAMHYTPWVPERYVAARDVFDDEALRALVPKLEGHIVLVGATALGLFDIRKTSLGRTVPGVEIHAQAIEQIINGQFLRRQDWTRGAELLSFLIAAAVIGLATLFSGTRAAFLLGGVVAAMVTGASWLAFTRHGVLLDPSFPLVGGLVLWSIATAVRWVLTDRDRRTIRGAFSQYVDRTLLEEIERNHRRVSLGGENREITVLFTDVRDFTALSERIRPEEVVAFLNVVLGRMAREITAERGAIDKFIGDSVMAFWNAPVDQPDHAARACRAALAIRAAMAELNAGRGAGLPPALADSRIEIGVGINTGDASVGNIGSAERFNYSVVGDTVNVAARAETASKALGYDLVVTRATARQAPGFAFLEAGGLRLRGKAEMAELLLLVGDEAVRASQVFVEFERRYLLLVSRLALGRPAEAEMADCRALAASLDPRLLGYLDRLPGRSGDFRARPHIALAGGTDA